MPTRVTTVSPLEAYLDFKRHGASLKRYLTSISNQLNSDIDGQDVMNIARTIIAHDNLLDGIVQQQEAQAPGELANFAKIAEGVPSYEPVTEYQATQVAMNTVKASILAIDPDALVTGFDGATGAVTYAALTPAQTASYKTEIDALLATLD